MVCFLNYPWPDQEKNILNSQALLKSMSTFFKWKLDVQNSPVCIWWQHPHTVPGYEVRFPEVKRNQKGYIQWKLVTYIEKPGSHHIKLTMLIVWCKLTISDKTRNKLGAKIPEVSQKNNDIFIWSTKTGQHENNKGIHISIRNCSVLAKFNRCNVVHSIFCALLCNWLRAEPQTEVQAYSTKYDNAPWSFIAKI